MAFKLPAECLYQVIEYLEGNETSLGSCLLVDRLWCTVAVRILWRDIWNAYHCMDDLQPSQLHIPSSILGTLVACLPNESKTLLNENGISIPTPTPKSPLFHYISFIQTLSSYKIERVVEDGLTLIDQQINLSKVKCLILQELLKAFMNQISSLKILNYQFS